jgi:hypothetical protein
MRRQSRFRPITEHPYVTILYPITTHFDTVGSIFLVDANVRRNRASCPSFRSVGRRCFMRLSVLAVSVILLFSQTILAQHSSGGGGSSGGSSAGSSGGGSHGGGYSGGGSSGGYSGGHSSGGSVSHSSGSHSSSAGGGGTHSTAGASRSHTGRSVHEPGVGRAPVNGTVKAQPGKRSFFSFLRHPFRKPQPKPVPEPLHRICLKGACRVCPAGQANVGGRCVGAWLARNANLCSSRTIWSGGPCWQQTPFLDACSGLRSMLERQTQRMQAADSARQNACATGATQECSELTSKAQSEASLYRALQERLRQCERGPVTANPYGGHTFGSYSRD